MYGEKENVEKKKEKMVNSEIFSHQGFLNPFFTPSTYPLDM